jgi:hypothetical protein
MSQVFCLPRLPVYGEALATKGTITMKDLSFAPRNNARPNEFSGRITAWNCPTVDPLGKDVHSRADPA